MSSTKPPGFNFARIIELKRIAESVFQTTLSPLEGTMAIQELMKQPLYYNGLWEILGYIFVAAAIAFVYSVGWPDLLASMVVGLIAGVLSQWITTGSAFPIIAGFVVSTVAVLIHNYIHPINIFRVAIAGMGQPCK